MTNGDPGTRWQRPHATGDIERALDHRFGPLGAALVGLAVGWGAVAIKAGLDELAHGETGYIVLVTAVVAAAWLGRWLGGVTATAVILILHSIVFLGPDRVVADPGVEPIREILFLLGGLAISVVVGSRRAGRDQLVDALDEIAALAADVEARDARLEMMLAASGTGFWEWDLDHDRLIWSDAIFRQHGIEPVGDAPTMAEYLELVHPDDRSAFQAATSASIQSGQPFGLDFRRVRSDGSVHWTHGAGRTFYDETGRPTRMIGTGQDITERRRVERERDRLVAEERRAGEFREAFIDVISHELRTPITTIVGLTEILARPGRQTDEASRNALLEDVRSESERLHRLVEDLLVLSRVERGAFEAESEPIELRRLLARTVDHEAPSLPTIAISLTVEDALPIVAGEHSYVEQILRNLLGNAAKYTPAGTRVEVEARRDGEAVAIRVLDDGPGMPQGSLDRVFELFFRDPDRARTVAGSGIGLFVCSSLAEAMGGRMWAFLRPTGGMEFGFTMPVLSPDAGDAWEPVAGPGARPQAD